MRFLRSWGTICVGLGVALLTASTVLASSLPHGLSAANLATITRTVASGSALRILRSAEAYELWPGIKFGLETTIAPIASLRNLGDGDGKIDGINIVPRLYVSKGLFWGIELTFGLFPHNVINTVNTSGGILKWHFYKEEEEALALAAFAGYTSVTAFDRVFTGHNIEIGAVLSKDLVRLKPYGGVGVMRANGTFLNGYLASGVVPSASAISFHVFFGAEWEFPLHITSQIDIINLSPSISFLFSQKF